MTDNELNRAVARATGETVSEIRSRGFSPLTPLPREPEPNPRDWSRLVLASESQSLIDFRSPALGSRA
ncbi:hypothetical protein GC176_17420 [bacterium]|nr:hypothetical protein [bacterium]